MKRMVALVAFAACLVGLGIAMGSLSLRPSVNPVSKSMSRAGFAPVIQRNAAAIPGLTMTVVVAGTGQIDGTYIAAPVGGSVDPNQYWVTLVSATPGQAWPQGKVLVNRKVVPLAGGGAVVTLNAGAWYDMGGYGTTMGEKLLTGTDPLAGGSCSLTAPWQGASGVNSTATITVSP